MSEWRRSKAVPTNSNSLTTAELRRFKVAANKTNSHLYSQILQANGCPVMGASTLGLTRLAGVQIKKGKLGALLVGRSVAVRSKATGMHTTSFDRLRFKFHGHIKIMAETARNYGLRF